MISVLLMLVPFAVIVLFCATITVLTKQSFGRCFPISMIICMIILYCSQMAVHTFNVGILIIVAASVAAIPLLWIKRDCFRRFFVPGLFIWTGIFLFVFVWDYHRHFCQFDEFYFWGSMVKESLRLDQFYSVPESYLYIHKDYPPFITLIELFWCRLSGGYSESAASMAMHTLLMSTAVLPVSEYLLNREKIKEKTGGGYREKLAYVAVGLGASIVMTLILLLFGPWEPSVSLSILVDGLVAILFAYAMWMVYREYPLKEGFGLLELALLTTAIIMIKQVGMGFMLVILLYAVLLVLMRKKTASDRITGFIKYIVTIIAVPLFVQFTWKVFVGQFHIKGQFDMDQISLPEFLEILRGRKPGLQYETLQRYGDALLQRDICSSWIPFTVILSFVLLIAVVVILNRVFGNLFDRKDAAALMIAFACCTGGYIVLMAVLYTFCFNEEEMRQVASFMRYMASFMLGQYALTLYISLDLIKRKSNDDTIGIRKIMILTAVLILLAPMNLPYLMPQGLQPNNYEAYEKEADYISKNTEVDANIFVIYDNMQCKPDWYGSYQNYLRYYAGQRYYCDDIDVFHLDPGDQEMASRAEKEISASDYVYIRNVNDEVSQFAGEELHGGRITPNSLYSVEHQDDGLYLERIE